MTGTKRVEERAEAMACRSTPDLNRTSTGHDAPNRFHSAWNSCAA
jgi:hypothetical protein